MTEEETNDAESRRAYWAQSDHPEVMLKFIGKEASERKLRLFGCACCRSIWSLLDEPQRNAILHAELFADGLITPESMREVSQLWLEGRPDRGNNGVPHSDALILTATGWEPWAELAIPITESLANSAASTIADATATPSNGLFQWTEDDASWTKARHDELACQARLLRDIFGSQGIFWHLNLSNPGLFDPNLEAEWLTSDVLALARQMYESREFSAMPILADALQDAGCDNPDVLNHCRGDGPHVRGCWVVDLVLGKE